MQSMNYMPQMSSSQLVYGGNQSNNALAAVAALNAQQYMAAAAAADPYNVSNTLHNFQTSQVTKTQLLWRKSAIWKAF